MDRNARSSIWFWLLVVALVVLAVEVLVAVSTFDDACASPDTPRVWSVFPPEWECRPAR